MAFSNIDQLNLGLLTQIAFTKGVRNQLSEDFRDWSAVKNKRIANMDARSIQFLLQRSYGPNAVQARNPGATNRAFPDAQQATISEHYAQVKEVEATLELEQNLYDRAQRNPSLTTVQPLLLEIEAKKTYAQRFMSFQLHQDGTGVLGTVDSIDESAINTTGEVVITLSSASADRGFIGWFEYSDIVSVYAADATPRATAANGFVGFKVVQIDRDANTVTVKTVNATGAEVVSETASNIVAADVIYKSQANAIDLTAPISDYNTATEYMAGLESLTANDGRVVHGINMSGQTAGSRFDAATAALSLTQITGAINKAKLAAGEASYRYKQMLMAPEVHEKLVNDKEASRRFITAEDDTRGGHYYALNHRGDTLRADVSPFCRKDRIYMLPEDRNGEKVCELYGTDFTTIKTGTQDGWRLKSGSNGYLNMMVSYMRGTNCLIAKQPNSIAVVENFTL